ncbi:hypothetical protein P3T76_008363 [Phytophthora citrophthora]|uniref:Uncharacterized protein n=1 Tax=Phytophthora citrophthora TaxID=4793 RepID=A0AAD9LKP7_9STRA|nr:hypothetical protein P3T76_008363 [Phytophthora citrophthora]
MAGCDAVYESILVRVEKSELREQLDKVSHKECRSIGRHLRHATTSLTALKQLQEASKHLRPGGDWLQSTFLAQLKRIEEMQKQLEVAVDDLAMDQRLKKAKKRKRLEKENEEIVTVIDSEQDSDVEFLLVLPPKRTEVEEEDKEEAVQEEEEEMIEVPADEMEEETVLEKIKEAELPLGLVVITDESRAIKEEPVVLYDEKEEDLPDLCEEGESPLELEVFESEESEEEIDMSDAEESAIELDVPDSDVDDDFSSCMELVLTLQDARGAVQLNHFPLAVKQLRTYLLEKKHLTATDLDGYLFAHKHITDEEADEIANALAITINVGMRLRVRAKIKQALYDLLLIVEQLECTLGGLPTFLRP